MAGKLAYSMLWTKKKTSPLPLGILGEGKRDSGRGQLVVQVTSQDEYSREGTLDSV